MKGLSIEGTDSTPYISFDPLKGDFVMRGSSFSENAADFFHPIILWVEKYAEVPVEKTHLSVNMDLINDTSLKYLLGLFALFEDMKKKGKGIKISWWHLSEDDETKEIGEPLKSMDRSKI